MATKKNFGKTSNPALAFLGKIEEKEEVIEEKQTSENNPKVEQISDYEKKIKELEEKLREQGNVIAETKSKKINLLIYPSVLEDFDRVAKAEHKSRNDLANKVFREYADKYM